MDAVRVALFLLMMGFALEAGAASVGFHAGAGLGYVDLNQDEDDIAAAAAGAGLAGRVTELEDDGVGWKLFGGYRFNPYIGVEAAYADLGEADATFAATAPTAGNVRVEAEASALSASLMGFYPMNRELDLFGRIGAARWSVDGTASAVVGGASATVDAEDDGFGAVFGLGAEYSFSDQLGFRVEWERYQDVGDDDAGTDADVNTFGGSILYRF